jgi:hypothetical protein
MVTQNATIGENEAGWFAIDIRYHHESFVRGYA